MSRCSVVNFLHSFFFNNSKRAFTLAEALIITVMTGACLLPILGTMQNAQVRTENFDHQSKMQQYARSRLTQEIANAAFDHKSINLDDEYHYIVYFASSTSNENATEDEAKLIELPKSYATLEDLASLTIDPERSHWATSAVDLLGISRDKGAPYLKVVHAYKTSVETQYDIKLATYTPGVDTEGEDDSFSSPKGLLAIVVRTSLLQSNDINYDENGYMEYTTETEDENGGTQTSVAIDSTTQVPPVTLFSFANLPIVSDEYIWIADSHNKKVVGIDPESRTLATEIDFKNEGESGKPLHIAVHPSGKILAVQAKKKVFLVNIDIKSPFKGERKLVVSNSEDYATEEEGGIAFRTDGKVLYFTDKENNKLHIYELEYSFNSDNTIKWTQDTPSTLTSNHADILFSNNKFSNIVAANDGNLYIGENDSNIIHQYPMYSVFTNGNSYETVKLINTDKKIRSIDVSNDGKYLLYTPKEHTSNKSLARIYDTKTGKIVKTIEAAKELSYGIFSTISNKDSSVTDSSLFVVLTEKKKDGDNGAGVQVFGLDDKTCELRNSNIEENGRIIQSPYDSKVVFISKMKKGEGKGKDKEKDRANLYFSDFLYSTAVHTLTDEEAMGLNEEKGVSALHADLAANKRDIMAVAKENKHIDLYDLNTLKEIENTGFVATYSLADLTMSNQGTMLYSSHSDNAQGCYKYNLSDCSTVNPSVNTYRRKSVFDGNPQDMLFALQYTKNGSGNITNEGFVNIYYSTFDRWETIATDSYDRRDFRISPEWKSLDLIGMPNGGALVLYGKSDGSSMIEWIGRRNWGDSTKVGKYRLFSRWTNIKGSTKGASKTLPYTSFETCGNSMDGWIGMVFIMKDIELPINGKVVSLNAKSGTWTASGGETSRSIMPLLLEKQSDGTSFKIKDVGMGISFSNSSSEERTEIIKWKNTGGLIANSDYRLGFYNGRFISANPRATSPNAGVIVYSESPTDYTYWADYYANGDGLSNVPIDPGSIYNASVTLKQYPSSASDSYQRGRRYALSFNIAIPGNEFPPLGSKKLAVTPNQSMLAILATDTSNVPIVNLYDFNNQIYDHETQIEGLLVDYRIPFQSGAWDVVNRRIVEPIYNWPDESVDFFREVQSNCSFIKRSGETVSLTLKEASTKNDSWKIFNKYPANYYVSSAHPDNEPNISKEIASKRYFGYFRPSFDVNYMQTFGSEDIRFFLNKNFIGGRTDVAEGNRIFDPAMNFNIKENEIALFQKDEASNVDEMRAQIFLASISANLDDVATYTEIASASVPVESYYKIKDGYENLFDYMRSEQTQILNNRPSFMASFKAIIDSSTSLNITNTSMLFSRDRAKPVLYLTGSTYLWALYRNSLIRVKQDDDSSIKTNLAISTDGQKLLYGKTGGTSGVIRVVDISSPDDSKFRNTVLTTKEENVSGFSNSYLSKITDLSLDSAPSNLATKPFNSYSSEKTGGNYELMATEDFSISSNAVAVASGGIYIVNNASSTIGVYNPVTSYNTVEIKNDVLEKNANSVAVTAYDDNLYLFGNAGATGDELSGRVQSYDVNTGEARTSFHRSGDTYRANIFYSSSSSSYVNIGCEPNHNGSDCSNAFDGRDNTCWSTGGTITDPGNNPSGWIRYKYTPELPFVVNKIRVNNDSHRIGVYDGTKKFEFCGIKDDDSEVSLASGTLAKSDEISYIPEFSFNNNTAFKKYKFKGLSTHDTGTFVQIGLAELTMYRTDLVRLTPMNSDITSKNTSKYYMHYANSKVASATLFWSAPSETSYNFCDIFGNYTDSNYSSYEGGGSQGWQSSDSKPYLKISFEDSEVIRFLRYANGDNDTFGNVIKIHIYGNNDNKIPSVSNTPTDDGWIEVASIESLPNIKKYWISQEISNNSSYKHYLFVFEKSGTFRITAFEVYGQANNGDSLTPMLTDDLGEVEVGNAAACATPYGLVTTGGLKGTTATTTALLYWPHAINKYDGQYYQHGISRSLPNMKSLRKQHSMVWHKGKIYVIGGCNPDFVINGSVGSGKETSFIECLDYNDNMNWKFVRNASYTFPVGVGIDDLYRYNHGACSFGDEIFIFGGTTKESSDNKSKSAYAWNPETGNVRKLTDLLEPLSPCSAVAFGSKIYVIGMGSSNKLKIYEYTP